MRTTSTRQRQSYEVIALATKENMSDKELMGAYTLEECNLNGTESWIAKIFNCSRNFSLKKIRNNSCKNSVTFFKNRSKYRIIHDIFSLISFFNTCLRGVMTAE